MCVVSSFRAVSTLFTYSVGLPQEINTCTGIWNKTWQPLDYARGLPEVLTSPNAFPPLDFSI